MDLAGAGFKANIYILPSDVSFSRIQFREGASTQVSTGSFQGAFNTRVGSEQFALRHPVLGDWLDVLGGNATNGCRVDGKDKVDSGDLAPPFTAGSFIWDISWFYRVVGSNVEFEFLKARHHATVTATGQMTISNGGHADQGAE
jgi:hypothetical protein